ncbi:MAG: hypothetical protein M1546_24500 [Chloroflexi bacterium]|nr:hypothetical protein [Chloroflexota bacterium]
MNPFHYPTAEWSVGDVVLDQLTVTPPLGAPPIEGYQVGISFFNPDNKDILPRLKDERYAGLEVTFPISRLLPSRNNASAGTSPASDLCAALPETSHLAPSGLQVRTSNAPAQARPGEKIDFTLCWLAPSVPLSDQPVTLDLIGATTVELYRGAPAHGGYPFSHWRVNELVVDRFSLRVPRDTPAGRYTLNLSVGMTRVTTLGQMEVPALPRHFALPSPAYTSNASFDGHIKLLGYDRGEAKAGEPLSITLYWQSLAETELDYTVFVHLVSPDSGQVVAQVDEQPQRQGYPTSLWAKDEIVPDEHTLTLPALAAGRYEMRAGLYVQETGEHLLVDDAEGYKLGSIEIGR